jgi:hypothetical protein
MGSKLDDLLSSPWPKPNGGLMKGEIVGVFAKVPKRVVRGGEIRRNEKTGDLVICWGKGWCRDENHEKGGYVSWIVKPVLGGHPTSVAEVDLSDETFNEMEALAWAASI